MDRLHRMWSLSNVAAGDRDFAPPICDLQIWLWCKNNSGDKNVERMVGHWHFLVSFHTQWPLNFHTVTLSLIRPTSLAYQGWHRACGEYADIIASLNSLRSILRQISTSATSPSNWKEIWSHLYQDEMVQLQSSKKKLSASSGSRVQLEARTRILCA